MAESESRGRWRPSRTQMMAGSLVFAGFLLMNLSWWFLLLVGIGALGPGILRELGWLQDKDEFQRRADHRAGYHAFLAAGAVAFLFVPFFRSGDRRIPDTEELATLFLVLLWFTWMLSSLIAYWGPRKAAARILYVFGTAILIFAVLGNLGSEWTGWGALLLSPLIAAPFYGLAWLSGSRTRLAGILLLLVFVGFGVVVGVPKIARGGRIDDGVVFILFLGPLLAGGISLLTAGEEEPELEEEEEEKVMDAAP